MTASNDIASLAKWLFRSDHQATGNSDLSIDTQWRDQSNWNRDRYLRLAEKLLADPPEVLVRVCKESA